MGVSVRRAQDAPAEVPARRRAPRVSEIHTAALRVRGQEVLCKTCDLSEGGVGLVTGPIEAAAGDAVAVDILFHGVLRRFGGQVAFVRRDGSAVRLGVGFRS